MRPVLLMFALALFAPALAAEPTAARTVLLVRHGHYAADPSADPRLGPSLTAFGIAQARLVGARLAGKPFVFDTVWVSPLTRAQETARVIAQDLGGVALTELAELEECTPPTRRSEITASMKPEDLSACAAQLDKLFAEHFKPADGAERNELMVCHGNVIRYLITKALGVDSQAWLELSVGHTSITQIRIEADGSFKLISAGDVGHLPPHLLTGATGDAERSLSVP